jgi:hypothetical protein
LRRVLAAPYAETLEGRPSLAFLGGQMKHVTHSEGRTYHAVRFYENERSLARIVAEFLDDGLRDGEPGIVVATPTQRAAIVRELVVRGVDVVGLKQSGELVLLDAEDTLSGFMRDGQLDAGVFNERLCVIIERACQGRTDCTVRIYGQMVDILWKQRQCDLAIRLEMLWNQLAQTQRFSLLCGYAMGPFYKNAQFRDICAQHTHVLSADGTANVA